MSNFDEIYIQVFKRLVATSRAPQIMVLSMLRSFGKIGPQIDQIWAWLSRGHRWSAGVQNPLKGSVTGPSLLVNCYLEINCYLEPPPLNFFANANKSSLLQLNGPSLPLVIIEQLKQSVQCSIYFIRYTWYQLSCITCAIYRAPETLNLNIQQISIKPVAEERVNS